MKTKSSTRSPLARLAPSFAIDSTRRRLSESGSISLRTLLGLTFALSGIALAIFAGKDGAARRSSDRDRYMPVPGANSRDEAARLAELEQYWHDRLTYPTGRFDPAWLRVAAAQHARMARGVPAGQHLKLDLANPNALST